MDHSLHSLINSIGLKVPSELPNPLIQSITRDSRKIDQGGLFLGLPGETFDGGCFWQDALESGAVAAVIGVSAALAKPPGPKDPVIVIKDPIEKWVGELVATFWENPSSKLSLIGVTGTNGKTTTTHLIEYLSSKIGKSSSLFGTLCNRWPSFQEVAFHTTEFPEALQAKLFCAVSAGAEIAAMEVSSHSLAQYRIAGCCFSGAVFTNLTQDHLDYHHSMEEYFEVKTRLFKKPYLEFDDAKSIVNIDNKWGDILARELQGKCWKCSLDDRIIRSGNVELFFSDLKMTSAGVSGCLHSPKGNGYFFSPLIGDFNLMNLLQAFGSLLQQGLPLQQMLDAISGFPGVPGRMEKITIPQRMNQFEIPTVIVDYAHTPDALKNALISLRSFGLGKLICVFGCGGDRDRGKRPKMGSIASHFADWTIVTSDNPRNEDPTQIIKDIMSGISKDNRTTVEVDRSKAIRLAIASAESSDLILIAGKGHENYQIVGDLKKFFDDRICAQEAIEEKVGI